MPSETKVALPPYDYKTLSATGLYLLLGKRGAHKTTWCELIQQKNPFSQKATFVVFCGNARTAAKWRGCTAKLFVHSPEDYRNRPEVEFESDYICEMRSILREQDRQIAYFEARGMPLPIEHHVNIILDDVALYKKIMRDPFITEISGGSRNLGAAFWFLAQFLYQIVRETRKGFNQVMCAGKFDPKQIKEIHFEFASSFIEEREFKCALLTGTENKNLFIIDTDRGKLYEEKMPPIVQVEDEKDLPVWPFLDLPRMKFGPPEQWQYSGEFTRPHNMRETESTAEAENPKASIRTFHDTKGTVAVWRGS